MRKVIALILLVSIAACGSRRRDDGDWILPEVYRTDSYYRQDLSSYDKQLPKRLRDWKWFVLDRSNFLSTLQLRRDTARHIVDHEDRIEQLRRMSPYGASGKLGMLQSDLRFEHAKMALIKRHLARSPLPADEANKLRVWVETVLAKSTIRTTRQMENDTKDRIRWLEGKITEREHHHEDVVWKDYLHFNLMLHFEVQKLGLINRRLKG